MKLIRNIPEKTKNGRKMGLFQCPRCRKQVKQALASGAKASSCGCVDIRRRTCLMCDKKFTSLWVGNRRCPECEQEVAQSGNNTYYEVPKYGGTANLNIKINRALVE